MLSITPPTDNLYKFSAISGLVLLVLGFGYPALKTHEIELQINEVKTGIDISSERRKAFQEAVDRLSSRDDASRGDWEKLFQFKDEQLIKLTEQNGQTERLKILNSHARTYYLGGLVLAFVGATLMLFGFTNWFKIQRILDRALLHQVRPPSSPPQGE